MSEVSVTLPLKQGQSFPASDILVSIRFDAMVNKLPGDGCWEWTGKTCEGYGRYSRKGHEYQAHRESYQFVYGKLACKLFACHSCDNRKCVRPDHLFAGTHTDNMRDMWAKGRGKTNPATLPGEANPMAELTERDVRLIRGFGEFGIPQKIIASVFGISVQHVSDVLAGNKWKHLDA